MRRRKPQRAVQQPSSPLAPNKPPNDGGDDDGEIVKCETKKILLLLLPPMVGSSVVPICLQGPSTSRLIMHISTLTYTRHTQCITPVDKHNVLHTYSFTSHILTLTYLHSLHCQLCICLATIRWTLLWIGVYVDISIY